MIRSIENRRLLAGALATALASFLAWTASAEEGEGSLLQVFSITEESFVQIPASESPSGPVKAAFVAPGAGWGSAGVHRFSVG